MGPLVSVLIPCYNAERWVGETLDSVLRQSWQNIEVIVVDDGSQDESRRAVEAFHSPKVKLVQQSNAGAAVARNRALAESSGAFVQFLDADDLLDPNKIQLQMRRLVNQPDCVAMAEWARFYRDPGGARFVSEETWKDMEPMDWLVTDWNDGGGMMYPAMWLIPRNIVERAGPWSRELTLADDTEYFTRVVLSSRHILFCDGARTYYRSGISGSLSGLKSRSGWVSQFKVLELCEGYLLAREDSERTLRVCSMLWQRFAHGCYPYYRTLANQALRRAMKLHSHKIYPEGGPMFRMASRLLGWKTARSLQKIAGRG